jgi:hypothetical protein
MRSLADSSLFQVVSFVVAMVGVLAFSWLIVKEAHDRRHSDHDRHRM